MRTIGTMVIAVLPMLFAGCTGREVRENMYHGMYDGLRTESRRGTTPAENAAKPDMSYDRYKQERQELLKRD